MELRTGLKIKWHTLSQVEYPFAYMIFCFPYITEDTVRNYSGLQWLYSI